MVTWQHLQNTDQFAPSHGVEALNEAGMFIHLLSSGAGESFLSAQANANFKQ